MGPWWMTLSKLETAVRELRDQVLSARSVHPELAHTLALVHAEAAVARAHDSVRRLKPPRAQPGEQTLKYASDEIARAAQAVQRARDLATMAGRRAGGPVRSGFAR